MQKLAAYLNIGFIVVPVAVPERLTAEQPT